MRFKTYLPKEAKHTDLVSCVGWYTTEVAFSAGDDHQLLQWSLKTGDATKVADLPEDIFPTDLHWFPRLAGAAKKQSGTDLFALTSTDGKFHLVSKAGRIEKSVEAHRGAVLAGRWSHDGTALVTSGEDGQIKIWSRSGMLRSTLSSNNVPIYSIAWGPNSDQILYTLGSNLVIKSLQPNSKPLQWKAHEALILKVAWNPNNTHIVSGGEDCKYKVWDMYGRLLYTSGAMDYPVTSLAWSPDGELFSVGSFNTLRLCDKTGWSFSLDKPQTQSIYSVSWSSDGTQVAGACGNGHVVFAHVIEKRLEWKNFEATVRGRKTIVVRNVSNDVVESLDFTDNIIKTSLGYSHLIVVTSNQCFIYSTRNWNTPQITDLKEGNASLIMQAEKYFLLVDGGGVILYSYDGKALSSPKWPGMRPDILNTYTVSLSNDAAAIRDKSDEKVIFLFDTQTGRILGDGKPYTHKAEVLEVALDQCGLPNERKLSIIDKNNDLYLTMVRPQPSAALRSYKLGAMMQSMQWNDSANILATLQEGGRLIIWYYPNVVFVDPGLLPRTITERRAGEFGKNPQIVNFIGNHITLRRADGSQVSVSVSPYASVLHGYVASSHWEDALRLCRFVNDEALWGCLAAMSTAARDLNTAEVAYAALEEVDKVYYIQHIKSLPQRELRDAEMALLCRNNRDAETYLLQAGLPFRAILNNIHNYNWDRALDLALRNKCHLDTVIAFRQKYLQRFEMEESNKKFLEHSKGIEINWDKINEEIERENQREQGGP